MSDWADEEAERLSNYDRDTREESQWVCDQIASALRKAKADGEADGARKMYAVFMSKETGREQVALRRCMDDLISRADAIEKGQE